MKKRKLIILSLDAMVKEDIEYLKDKPLVKKMLDNGVWIKTLRTIFPANTYPCHSSMITGCYPNKTGVDTNKYAVNNEWRAERENIKVKTLFDVAKEAGYTTANVFWPVLGGDKSIDFNVPEYFPVFEEFVPTLKKQGTTSTVISEIVEPNLHLLEGHKASEEPYATRFIFSCARDIILKYQPDILTIHPCPLDTQRHRDGVFSENVTKALEDSYEWVVKLIEAVKEIGEEDNTDFVWMSDHGQTTIDHWFRFMIELKDLGLIVTDENDNIVSDSPVTAVSYENDFLLKCKDPETYDKVRAYLQDAVDKDKGITYYTKQTAKEVLHFEGDFDFLIDSNGKVGVGRELYGELNSTIAPGVVKKVGIHGHSPDIGYQPTLLCMGPDFKSGVVLERKETIDIPVTLAKCLGLQLPDADGKVIEEILK